MILDLIQSTTTLTTIGDTLVDSPVSTDIDHLHLPIEQIHSSDIIQY